MPESDTVATSTIGVLAGTWPDPDLAAMVAPPVVVTSVPVDGPADTPADTTVWVRPARSRADPPVGRHRGGNR